MIRKIIQDDHLLLRSESSKVESHHAPINSIIQDMLDTLADSGGIGLAAIQIGVPLRIVVIAHPNWSRPEIMVNPEIIESSAELAPKINEGCLSVPGQHGWVPRANVVKVRYLAANVGMAQAETIFSGMAAIIVQHEIDHLDGVLFIDKIKEE